MYVGDAEVWMPKRRMSNGVEAESLAAFASLGPFCNPWGRICPYAKFPLAANPDATMRDVEQTLPCGDRALNAAC